ncbi:MAG: hypothetical protein V2I47_00840 [Bacteroidales bacterium]|nr:hypothetical protein [Bacteroidales bacterium]
MRKLLVLVLVSLVVFGCKKDMDETTPMEKSSDISFQIDLVDPGAMKDWDCKLDINGDLLEPDYAEIVIDGQTYLPAVFRIDGILYTQNIKFLLGQAENAQLEVTRFVLWDDSNTPNDMTDDQIVMGMPEEGSLYEPYITAELRYNRFIDVDAFQKHQFLFEVLCFIDDEYENFGFDWFQIHEIVIREECFFGDICIKHLADYQLTGSPYLNQSTGIQLDMPALMEIVVTDAQGVPVPYSPFTNAADLWDGTHSWGVGAPLCIQWPDHLWIPNEMYYVDIYIWVMDGDYSPPFARNLFWQGQIDEMGVLYDLAGNIVPAGDDGIIELVLGECNLSNTDIQLVPYQNLPAGCDMQTSSAYAPGPAGTYFDVTLSNLTTGPGPYDIVAGAYGVYCGDQDATIYVPKFYPNTDVYGSLLPGMLPATMPAEFIAGLDNANWLMNNLDNYTGEQWNDIQWALWLLMDDSPTSDPYVPGPSTLANTMANDALLYGDGYLPPPGGWAAVIFHAPDPTTGTYTVQVVFTFVDP